MSLDVVPQTESKAARAGRRDSEEFVRIRARRAILAGSDEAAMGRSGARSSGPIRLTTHFAPPSDDRLTYRDAATVAVAAPGEASTDDSVTGVATMPCTSKHVRPPRRDFEAGETLDVEMQRAAQVGRGRTIEPVELFYDTIADRFDEIMNRYDLGRRIETIFDVLLRRYNLNDCLLLDAGCGTGWFSEAACRRGAIVTAVDIGPRLLDQVRLKCPATTMVGDVLDLDFPDETFDVVVSSECIEHTRDPHRAVSELLRVCRPGGLLALTCPNRRWYWACAIANGLRLRPYEGIENWPSWRELRRWLTDGGAEILDMRGIHLFPFQFAPLRPVLRVLDHFGRTLGPWCVNQAVLARRPC